MANTSQRMGWPCRCPLVCSEQDGRRICRGDDLEFIGGLIFLIIAWAVISSISGANKTKLDNQELAQIKGFTPTVKFYSDSRQILAIDVDSKKFAIGFSRNIKTFDFHDLIGFEIDRREQDGKVNYMSLKILLRDIKSPIQEVRFFNGEGMDTSSKNYISIFRELDQWNARFRSILSTSQQEAAKATGP